MKGTTVSITDPIKATTNQTTPCAHTNQGTGRVTFNPKQPLTPAQSTPVLDDDLGAHITAPIETTLRDIDDQCTARENEELPFLAAQMVVSDYRTQAYGRRTHVWLHYGRTVGTLTPAQARQALDAMRAFTAQLEAVVDLAEVTAAGDFDGDPEIARYDREAERQRIRAITEAGEHR